jgi:hypothetical protein
MHESSIILKQDRRGRLQVPPKERAALLADFEHSGLPGAQFARLAGIKYSTFMGWVGRKRRSNPLRQSPPAPLLLEAVVADAPSVPGLSIELGGSLTLKITHACQVDLAAQLIHTLRRPC